ncbi:hypothetical protein [Streptomyces mirabilis]|uniref:hypothetical protein n=1 Tax=Streptomyces mirabilis TaxID=68239 RepID=UPI0036663192
MADRHRAGRAGRTVDDTLVWQALEAVGMRESADRLPHRLDTLPARELFGGTELYGGQWQPGGLLTLSLGR